MILRIQLPLVGLGFLLSVLPGSAVVVGGTSGTGTNNDTEAGLVAHLTGESLTPFTYWDNLVRVSDASGVYLGKNTTTNRGWVLSANHVTPATSIGIAGQTYTVSSSIQVDGSDLQLYEFGGGGDPALPTLPSIPLASSAAVVGETSLMFGRGFTTTSAPPHPWGAPGTNDANGMRWGTNTIEGNQLLNLGTLMSPNIQPYVYVDFDGPGDLGVTAFDAQATLGDSGGGLFVLRSGVWELSGITHLVDDAPDFFEPVATGDGVVNPSEYGDFSGYSDVFSKVGTINTETGALVPEPSAIILCALGLGLLNTRQRKRPWI